MFLIKEIQMKKRVLSLALLTGVCAIPSLAQATSDMATQPAATQAAPGLTNGEVRRIERETGKITIRHGAIENLGMPPMTMVLTSINPAFLDELKPGDQIRFAAEKLGGIYTLTRVERSN